MKQIKTVIEPFSDVVGFDNKVNKLLENGWKLVSRKTISLTGEPNEVGSSARIQMLCAELERHIPPFPEEITL